MRPAPQVVGMFFSDGLFYLEWSSLRAVGCLAVTLSVSGYSGSVRSSLLRTEDEVARAVTARNLSDCSDWCLVRHKK